MINTILLPQIIKFGAHASYELPNILQILNSNNILIVTDNTMVELGYVEKLVKPLKKCHYKFSIFSDTVPEPTISSIDNGVKIAKNGNFDCIVALGGGSCIDSAKAIAILAIHGGKMQDYKFPHVTEKNGLPVIAVPTTSGTGSEATKATIITNEQNDEKMLCMGPGFMPKVALVDFCLSMSVPPRTTADTGIDALTHAIEAFVSKKANAFSDAQALGAIKYIAPNLRTVFLNGNDIKAREQVMIGSTLAGIAFSNASVALVHAMSRPIGAFFHIPHGLSNAMLLPVITQYSITGNEHKYALCAKAMGVAQENDSDEQANLNLISELKALNSDLKVPTLEEYGVNKNKYFSLRQTMAEQALASGSVDNNPKEASVAEMIELYSQVWIGE